MDRLASASAELVHPWLSAAVQSPCMLTNGCAPSVVNGGLDKPEMAPAFGVLVGVGAVSELVDARRRARQGLKINEWAPDSIAGDVNFDPFKFAADLPVTERFELQEAEMLNGRLAMLALVAYTMFESTTGMPVVSALELLGGA